MPASRVKFVVKQTSKGWRWVLVNRGNVVAQAPRYWATKALAKRAAESVAKHAVNAPVVVEGE